MRIVADSRKQGKTRSTANPYKLKDTADGLKSRWTVVCRTLSPNTNFWNLSTPPAAYDSGAAKVIVLMTDGVNGLADNGNSNSLGTSSANISDYSAYGYLGGFRLGTVNGISQYGPVTTPTSPPTDLTTYFDNRLLASHRPIRLCQHTVAAEDIAARVQALRHLLKEVGHHV